MKIKFTRYLIASSYFLLSQGILIYSASSTQRSLEEQSQNDTLNKGVGQMSIQPRDSDTSEDSTMKEESPAHSPSIAQKIFNKACEIIPNLENPEAIKPNVKTYLTSDYSIKFNKYNHLKTLNKYFLSAIDGDNESKELLALWLLKGKVIKGISQDFYESYDKSLLKTQIEQLLNEYRDSPDPELDIDANVLLDDLNYYAEKW
ncbi:MAG: hypothetical protein Q8S21_06815 [Candidatus Paracaedibacteraceae bacterium]|nr:hypothetical protein [Candidatus Paracaedibacteraceae bacterium]